MSLGRATAKWVWVAAALTVVGCSSAGSGALLGTLPGAEAYPKKLQQKLASALSAQGANYVPRTQHLNEDGSPKFVNRLMLESSPYLRQHAHNPVNWFPWGDEAFETAKRLNRPVLLSIGYSTCHWCHVMEEESFEDTEIAAYLNANYVAIKVDREERPDLDAIYMAAVYALHGRGGWPMTTWLTPDREPFYGGTYFPPRDGMRRNRRGFLPLLEELKQLYDSNPDKVAGEIQKARQSIENRMSPVPGRNVPGERALDAAVSSYRDRFDAVNGGAKRAPKFPSNFPVRLLYRYHRRTGQAEWRDMATFTLEKMARGGIHDQVGGGFHRYSTDARWLVPHFEKMLYDNAQLTMAYLEGFQVTGRADFAEVARKTLRYVAREMTSPDGAFYSATDADSPTPDGKREEGWFFIWTPAEIRAVLGEEEARPFEAYYGVTPRGNFMNRTILNVPRAPDEVAEQLNLPIEDLEQRLGVARNKLYEARLERPGPLRDEKILTSWNGLMISAMARGGFVLDEPEFVERAARAADFLLKSSRKKGRLFRSFKDGRARHNAYLDDYAFLIASLLDLYEATSNIRWLREALALQKTLDENYLDEKTGGYFLTSHDHEQLLARERPGRDKAEPSGNSVAAMNLLRLHELTLDESYLNASEQILGAFSRTILGSPEMVMAVDFLLGRPKEVVIVTPGTRDEAEPLLEVLRETYLPNKVMAVVAEGRDLEVLGELIPMVRGKVARQGRPTAYVCEQGLCELPTGNPATLVKQLTASGQASIPPAQPRQ